MISDVKLHQKLVKKKFHFIFFSENLIFLFQIKQVGNEFLNLFAFCQRVYLTNQHEITAKEYMDLQLVSLILLI